MSVTILESIVTRLRNLFKPTRKGALDHLHTFFSVMPKMKECLRRGEAVKIIYFDIKNFTSIENEFGVEVCYEILSYISQEMLTMKTQLLEKGKVAEVVYGGGDDFFLLLFNYLDSPTAESTTSQQIKECLLKKISTKDYPHIDLYSSSTLIKYNLTENIDHLIYRELKSLSLKAKDDQYREYLQQKELMNSIIEEVRVYPVYQPIVSLRTGEIFGREALTRAKKDLKLNPIQLFGLATKTGTLLKFERLVRQLAIEGTRERIEREKLFINISPKVINEYNFKRGETQILLEQIGFRPEDIVLEITESSAIKDFQLFSQVVEHYRAQGYQIAVDDAGAGFSTLQVIAELNPDFIKVDMSLVRKVDRNPVKQALVEALTDFARKTGAKVVAEGIETYGELERLIDLGIDYGQGYLLARPGEIQQQANSRVVEVVKQRTRMRDLETVAGRSPLKEIIEFNQSTGDDVLVKDVVKIFENYPRHQGIVIVNDRQQPVGLVMKDRLYYKLGSPYGYPLFMKRPITDIMDHHPLIIDIYTNLNSVANLAMKRDSNRLYDLIIVTEHERYHGVISIRSLLERINKIQIELARDSNPLTGLPGNKQIENALNHRIGQRKPFGVIYADLDNFKKYNDVMGYDTGDKILVLVSKVCQQVLVELNDPEGFVGHIGGDDFMLITSANKTEEVANALIQLFSKQLGEFLKDCQVRHTKPLSISLASGIFSNKNYATPYLISQELAQLKAKSKKIPGNSHYQANSPLS